MIYTDIFEVKTILSIPLNDNSEDIALNFYIEQASSLIDEFLNRPDISYKSRTEYYNGSGTQKLNLRSRPVFTDPTIQVFTNDTAYFGSVSGSFDSSTALTYGTDFALQIDQENGSSRSGILININKFWNKPSYRQRGFLSPFIGEGYGNIKVIYTAGYTVDTLPAGLRGAANLLVARMRYVFPLGMELTSESYEDRAIAMGTERRDYLLALVKPMLFTYRNWRW